MKFKSTKIELFAKNTKRSDIDVSKKHGTLLKFIDKDKFLSTNRALIGDVLIPDENAEILGFKYPEFRINDTNDLTGWNFFNPAEVNNK